VPSAPRHFGQHVPLALEKARDLIDYHAHARRIFVTRGIWG